MDLRAPSYLPFSPRDAYQPGDPNAYLMLRELRCVLAQDGVFDPDPLCTGCREILIGEPLLDDKGNETEYRIAFYALPCGHGRCCACALKFVDTAGLFYQICQCCDSKQMNVKLDLSGILDSIGYGAEPALPPGFDEIKWPRSPIRTEYSPIRLATISEVEYNQAPETPSRLNLSALKLQTPATKRVTLDLNSPTRQINPAKRRKVDYQDQEDPPQISSFQWTPINFTRLPIPIKKQNGEIGYRRGGVYTAKVERSAPRPRGVVGADPNELKIREANARKRAFDKECFAAGTSCDEDGSGDIDEDEMEGLIFEMAQFESPRKASVGKEGNGRKKSFAARLMSRSG
ncbi:MAG: hypothetical protein Q9208_004875 [Pyrenodesmia sp. 3 TL-2023]